MTIAVAVAAAGLAALLQGICGFGFAIVFVPLASLAVGTPAAVTVATFAGIVSNGWIWWKDRHATERRLTSRVLAAAALGVPIGAWFVTTAPPIAVNVLLLVSAVGTLVVALRPSPAEATTDHGVVHGLLAGFLTTTTGASGPPVVAAVRAAAVDPTRARATISGILGALGVLGGLVLGASATTSAMVTTAAVLPVAVLTTAVGRELGNRIAAAGHRRIATAMLAGGAIISVVPLALMWTNR